MHTMYPCSGPAYYVSSSWYVCFTTATRLGHYSTACDFSVSIVHCEFKCYWCSRVVQCNSTVFFLYIYHRYDSQSSAVSSSSGAKLHVRKLKKPMSGLDDALECLHSEPSGWGDLPSPKPTDVDNGTEIWGVSPDDIHRKIKHANGTYCVYIFTFTASACIYQQSLVTLGTYYGSV